MRVSFSEIPKWVGPTLHPQAILHKHTCAWSVGRLSEWIFAVEFALGGEQEAPVGAS